MIEVKEETLERTLTRVFQQLGTSESKIISFTKKIKSVNPLHFFEAGAHIDMKRSFWMSTIDQFTMVGIGDTFSINSKQTHLSGLEKKWDKVIEDAIIHNPYEILGTGLSAVGGMDFDPKKKRTELWGNFAPNELRIPTFMLLVKDDTSYLTINVMLHKDNDLAEVVKLLNEQEDFLLSYQMDVVKTPEITKQEAVEASQWKQLVNETTERISTSELEKVVLARELRLNFTEEVHLTGVLDRLIETQPTSYIFAYEKGADCFVGATPERLVKVEDNELLSTCLAGTAPRGKNPEEDEQIGYDLLHDPKNLEEHDFVVQMIKNSLEEYCTDMKIPNGPVLYKLRNLQHLYTPVRGNFKSGYSIFDCVEKLHPTPALGGEPRDEALAYIRDNEILDRGWYGAPFGWIDSNKNGEFAVAIRSGLIQGDSASLFAGCGVVKDSDPEAEFEETRIKFLPMLNVLGG